jgi:predicted Zn-dependent protease
MEPQGEGPGHRDQPLALSPAEELEIGRELFPQVLKKYRVVDSGPQAEQVRRVSQRVAKAAEIEPLRREINLHVDPGALEWESHVLESDQVNAFCLPGGKIAVFTGLLELVENDDQLAAVIAHEVAHALAHHASERLARAQTTQILGRLSFNRAQESEADHIGIFLMTFAGYDPEEAVAFWMRMREAGRGELKVPEILSDHPSDERRIRQIEEWIGPARGAKRAFDEGRIAPAAR